MTAAKKEMIQKTALDLVTVLNIMHYAEASTDNDWDIAAGRGNFWQHLACGPEAKQPAVKRHL